jgi:hypothetical protein
MSENLLSLVAQRKWRTSLKEVRLNRICKPNNFSRFGPFRSLPRNCEDQNIKEYDYVERGNRGSAMSRRGRRYRRKGKRTPSRRGESK